MPLATGGLNHQSDVGRISNPYPTMHELSKVTYVFFKGNLSHAPPKTPAVETHLLYFVGHFEW